MFANTPQSFFAPNGECNSISDHDHSDLSHLVKVFYLTNMDRGKDKKRRLKHFKQEFPHLFLKTKTNLCSLSIRINRKTCSHCSYPSGRRFWQPASQDSHRPHLSRLDPAHIINHSTLLKKQMCTNFQQHFVF